MLTTIDGYLDRITMYRLVLYLLIGLVVFALLTSLLGFIAPPPFAIIVSVLFSLGMCWAANRLFATVYAAPVNVESSYITALILALILPPAQTLAGFLLLGWAAILAMASKYILAINKKHLFNPAAIAVVLTAIGFGGSASWWVGNAVLTPAVIVGGLLIVRKMGRGKLFAAFLLTVILASGLLAAIEGRSILTLLNQLFFHSALFFLAGVMLTEPLTMPPTASLRIIYGAITGFLFLPQIHIGGVYTTPELALVVGNVFAYIVSPKEKLWLILKEKIQLSPHVFDFVFYPQAELSYLPGQYMEWTLAHNQPDSRGNRRYFTLASSPTENNLRLGVKFSPQSSSYKIALRNLDDERSIIASQLAGSFTLPRDASKKLAFIAGGIGITPFRSMIKYLLDIKQARSIVLLYSNRTEDEIVYRDVFDRAEQELDIRTVYTLTDINSVPQSWEGKRGRIDASLIREAIPDYRERVFYLSGPHALVSACEQVVLSLGVKKNRIIKDYFPGLT